jgi:hypothetical protein
MKNRKNTFGWLNSLNVCCVQQSRRDIEKEGDETIINRN